MSPRGMRYLSVCSGIEAATVAWEPLGWAPVAFSEIEAFPSAVLAHHYPHTPNWGDMERFHEWPDADVDLLIGGTPCQSFSVAGLRKGMDDPRGNLTLIYLAIAAKYRPEWLVWENVPGVLSADGGRAFGAILGALGKLGYGWAYRILDAQYHGVAQRRRRVFVVGHLGDWRAAAAVLFEPESLRGDPPPSRESGERAAPTISARAKGGGGLGTDTECDGGLIPQGVALRGRAGGGTAELTGQVQPTIAPAVAYGLQTDVTPKAQKELAYSLKLPSVSGGGQPPAVAYGGNNTAGPIDVATACNANGGSGRMDFETETFPVHGMAVRRLTPRECERLMGLPDDYTAIPWRGKPVDECPDGPRYKALGNSMAVPVVRWIGWRIAQYQEAENAISLEETQP